MDVVKCTDRVSSSSKFSDGCGRVVASSSPEKIISCSMIICAIYSMFHIIELCTNSNQVSAVEYLHGCIELHKRYVLCYSGIRTSLD